MKSMGESNDIASEPLQCIDKFCQLWYMTDEGDRADIAKFKIGLEKLKELMLF